MDTGEKHESHPTVVATMRYVNETLGQDERIFGGPFAISRWEYLTPWSLLLVPILFIWLRRYSTEYAVTTRRVVKKTGFISREGDEIRLRRVESVQVSQGLFGRLLDYGDIRATGQGNQIVTLRNVVSPMKVKQTIEMAIEQAEATPSPPNTAALTA
jgi:uncharacterized membrane protein YdbT with pleckstrin-like domain